jgi:hypothetical protein
MMPTLNMSAAWFMVPVAFGAGHSALRLLRVIAGRACGARRSGRGIGGAMSIGIFPGFSPLGVIGMPIAFSLGFAALVALAFSGEGFAIIPQRMMHAVNSFPLMSIPFFMPAGRADGQGRHRRSALIELANAVVGRVRGGLAQVTMLSGAGLATVSGAAVSDASALSTILGPFADEGLRQAASPRRSSPRRATSGPSFHPAGAMIVYALHGRSHRSRWAACSWRA